MKFLKYIFMTVLFGTLLVGLLKFGPGLIDKYLIKDAGRETTVKELIKDLGSEDEDRRWDAYEKLVDMGPETLPLLKKAATSDSAGKRVQDWSKAVINAIKLDNPGQLEKKKKNNYSQKTFNDIFKNYSLSFGVASDIYDGDTVKLRDGRTIRYLGVDTPEISHGGEGYDEEGGREAFRQNRINVANKRLIIAVPEEKEYDSYGRLLGYIFAPRFENGDYYLNMSRYLVENNYGQELYGNYDRDLPLKLNYDKLKDFAEKG